MTTLNLFPARIRFTNTDGTLTPEAYRALQVLFERVGGALGDNGVDMFAQLGAASQDARQDDVVTQQATESELADMLHQSAGVDLFTPDVVQKIAYGASFAPDVVQPANEAAAFNLAAAVNAAPGKTTPVDADVFPLADSAASFTLKKLSWANIKATLATWIAGNLIPASFTTLDSSGLATLGSASGGNQIRGRNHSYSGSNTWVSTVGDGAERIRFGHYDSSTVAFPTGLVPSQVLAGVSRIDIAARDIAGSSVNLRAGSGVPVIASVTSTGLAVTGSLSSSGSLTTTGGASFHVTSTALNNGSGASAGTLTNAPAAGNPTKWIGINDNGTIRYIPSW